MSQENGVREQSSDIGYVTKYMYIKKKNRCVVASERNMKSQHLEVSVVDSLSMAIADAINQLLKKPPSFWFGQFSLHCLFLEERKPT
jgi:hypothetical protein